jgi:hypothetical protein
MAVAPLPSIKMLNRMPNTNQGSTTTVNGTERMLRDADDQSLH